MKIKVTCGCGSVFEAPDSLAGQVVRCPACRKPLKVPGVQAHASPPVPPASGSEPNLNDLSALDQVSLDSSGAHGSTAGRSAIRMAPKPQSRRKREAGESAVSDHAISQEVDDRMTRLYEVYAGKEMRIKTGGGSKVKLLIGMGIAAATIGIGLLVGWNLIKDEYDLDAMLAGKQADPSSETAPAVVEARKQAVDITSQWKPTDAARSSGVALTGVEVTAETSDDTRTRFDVRIVPASKNGDRRLSMATSVVLYRSLDPAGDFTQVDRVPVEGFDSATGALSFTAFDDTAAGILANVLYYRLSGFDSDGKRLFDTSPAGFAHVPQPSVAQNSVAWSLNAPDKPAPAMRVQARLDAPGWQEVLLWQVTAQGSMKATLPDLPDDLPWVIESAIYRPTGIALDGQGIGRWRMQWDSRAIEQSGASGKSVIGAAPYAYGDAMDYRLTPDESSFSSVSRSVAIPSSIGRSRTVTFTPPGSAGAQTLIAQAPPGLSGVTATAYNGRIRLGWDSAALVAGLDQYEGAVQIVVRRHDAQGRVTQVAQLPVDSTGFMDTGLTDNQPVSYTLSLIGAGDSAADAMVHADAWIQGHGQLVVLTPCAGTRSTARVTPESQLDRLYVSLGVPELSYPETGLAASALMECLSQSLSQTPGVAVVDRAGLRYFVGADTGEMLYAAMPSLAGAPAQIQLRLVDSTGPDGSRLALWVTDLASGRSRLLARANAERTVEQTDLFITALQTYLASRLPEAVAEAPAAGPAPSLVVVGPIYPVDQPNLFYQSRDLADQLAQAGDQANDSLPVVSRRFWLDDTQQNPRTIAHASMAGTVLIVGRVWTGQDALPGVSLHAIDAPSGRLIDRFTSDRLDPEAMRAFAHWCGTLRLPGTALPTNDSPLLAAESVLDPIQSVWRQATPEEAPGHNGVMSFTDASDTNDPGAVIVSFGLPLPPALGGLREVTERPKEHPLHALRPYVAPQYPLTFDQWAQAYAEYVEADCSAFLAGFDQVQRAQQAHAGPLKPYLIVRGEHLFTGEHAVPPASGLRVTPASLNVNTFFPMGAAGQPMIDYRQDLSDAFRARPWLMAQAWKHVDPAIADPFLKGELYGVEGGRYQRLTLPEKPAPFHTYVAADLLKDIGNREGQNYRQRALERATTALKELVAMEGRNLTSEQKQWSTDALLVLVYEQDPGAIEQLKDQRFRDRYFEVADLVKADVLRMLVDRIGPGVWEWTDEFAGVDWDAFCWRSTREMDQATLALTQWIPESTRLALRSWLESPEDTGEDNLDIATASGQPTGLGPN